MAKNGDITRAQLIDLLKDLVDEKRTTTLYVRTDDNHLIVVGVDAGEIVSLICGPRRGERAIPMIRRMDRGTYRMEEDAVPYARLGSRLPRSETLLSLLSDGAPDNAEAGGDCGWVHDVLCKVLAGYMGPIAPLVCRETVSAAGGVDTPAKLRRVVDSLAGEIDDLGEAESFKVQAKMELGGLLH